MPGRLKQYASLDDALPIGFGQTNSQPSTVRLMLEWLEVEPGNRVLDVGSGSGWTTALLARLAGPQGSVHAVEIIPQLLEFGRDNVSRLGLENVKFHTPDRQVGYWPGAPYDRILVSATSGDIPEQLLEQLADNGILVIPIDNQIMVITKQDATTFEVAIHSGFVFVPLVV